MKRLLCFWATVLLLLGLSFSLLADSVHCDGTISVFFATPSNGTVDEELCLILQSASSTVDIAIYSFTLSNIAHTLESLAASGVTIRILMEAAAPDGVVCSSVRSNERIMLREVSEGGIFHHKFAILDGTTVITGSFNWSENAQKVNWENLVVIGCPTLAACYAEQFDSIWMYHSSPGCPQVTKVNINTATKSELKDLPGIRDVLADRIIEYRATHGPFSRIEDIMNVPHIKEGRFEQIKDLICVGWDCAD